MPGRLLHLPRGGILHGVERLDGPQASGSLRHFLQERWKGMWPILYGDQLRQARLDDWIFQGLLDVEHVPAETAGLDAVDAELEPATCMTPDVIVVGPGSPA